MKKGGIPNADDAALVRDRPSRGFVGLDRDGYEHPDPTPVEVPTRLQLPQRQVDRVREIVRREMSQAAADEGFETFEEADDFDLPGEDPVSPYEEIFEPMSDSQHAAPSKQAPLGAQAKPAGSAGPAVAKAPGMEQTSSGGNEQLNAQAAVQEAPAGGPGAS